MISLFGVDAVFECLNHGGCVGRVGFIYLLFAMMLGCSVNPPKENTFIANFYAHRSAYEHLRDMLQADRQVFRVTSSGVETANSAGLSNTPPKGGFPVERYNEYLALLKETGAKGVFRWGGEHSQDVGIAVWGSGWGGDTRHLAIAWMEHEPTNQVASLDAFYQSPKPRNPTFRRIDGNWYFWADW
jgi:hypothetical protein